VTGSYSKPLPTPQPESDYYWQSARHGKLVLQKCSDCSEAQFYPRVFCTHCGSRAVEWVSASGRGTLFTFAIVHAPPHPGFAGDVPYVTAIVALEEGPMLPSNIVGVEPEPQNLNIGMPLEVVFDAVTDEITLPRFRPAK